MNNLVSEYESGVSVDDLARNLGIGRTTVYRKLRAAGAQMRVGQFVKSADPDMAAALTLFNSGLGVAAVAERIGTTRIILQRAFRDAGIPTRNRSEQQFARMARMSPEDRQRLADAAHEAAKGREHTPAEKAKRARTNAARKDRASHYEVALLDMLRARGVAAVPQRPIGPYNCDIAIHPVAVEVWGGHWHWHGKHIATTEQRVRYLMDAGWHVLIVAVNSTSPLTPAVADYVVAETERLRRDPSAVREYRVIWRACEDATGGRADDDHFSVEPPFTNARDPATGQYKRVPR